MSDTSCKVLILDGGDDFIIGCAETVRKLGYQCLLAVDAISAINMIENDAAIGIVIADMSLAFTNDLNFLEQLDARFALLRSVVPIVMTDTPSVEAAIMAMNGNAVDLLAKPLEPEILARALRRALLRRSQLVSIKILTAFVTAQSTSEPEPEKNVSKAQELSTEEKLIKVVRRTITFRQRRNEYLGNELFADPAWDIVLELTLAKLQGEPVPVSSACAAAAVPFSTAYRYIGQLVDQGMVRRWKDPLDQRRVLLELEDHTHSAISDFLLSTYAFGKPLFS